MQSCHFCNQEQLIILLENQWALAFFDRFPVSRGHLLIIPKRHVSDFFDTTLEERMAMNDLMEKGKKLLDQKYEPHGYNIGINCGGAAGQTIFHVHLHLIPRYDGDMLDPSGGVRGVIPWKQKYK
ncbi:diadenosine tetraphosphate (Ap4A) HIT family hydrolase [Oikeobacillus pervagus]|uniref:Diadenosine tetraphosphate (Ap4A) HIT family hydrolase n=1 Tax=Oikeobacillus pervagus TaxID=1325931 RepID=A0AAJ1WK27_9BACI|nr:HIT family protein [Oikeobacillus pervagus]MDQ0216133.1 diadenosine tetraphosphate (Ap4A) HIT family hydrolase [Oikeobacillus pervagus]